jgi:hypothetical protein
MKARTVILLRGRPGQWPSRPLRDPAIPSVGLGNPPRRGCARARATRRRCMEGSQTSVGQPTDFSRPLVHVRSNAHAHSADRVADFRWAVRRGRMVDQARPHRRSGASAWRPKAITLGGLAHSAGASCAVCRVVMRSLSTGHDDSHPRPGAVRRSVMVITRSRPANTHRRSGATARLAMRMGMVVHGDSAIQLSMG